MPVALVLTVPLPFPNGDLPPTEERVLFEWFAGDFEAAGGVRAFLVAHIDDATTRTAVADARNRIAYFEYDWALNGRP